MDPTPQKPGKAVNWTVYRALLALVLVLFVGAITMRPLPDDANDGRAPYRLFIPFMPDGMPEPLSSSLGRAAVILTEVGPGQYAFGSAFVLAEGVVVTAAHVVAGKEDGEFTVFCNGEETTGVPFLVDAERDVAFVAAVCAPNAPKMRYRTEAPDVNEPLFRSGFTLIKNDDGAPPAAIVAVQYTDETSYVPGADLEKFLPPESMDETVRKVLDGMKAEKAAPLIGLSGRMLQGHSGSAVYDSEGALVGMAIIIDGARNRTFIVPAATILEDYLSLADD